ncbi:MAG: molecular chaperone DnaJ [Nanoarchaeota archaeon]|nr:molecular chaperone DnaJ [Nanoarchaeota archaeon]
MAKDYYKTLGVDKSASREEIKKAYKTLAKKYHPDMNKEADAADRFKEINEAASVLGDPKKREQYDRFGTADFSGFQGGTGGFDFSDFGKHSESFDFGDIFDSLFSGGFGGFRGSRRRGPRKGRDLRYDLEIELEDAVRGAEKEIFIPRLETCSKCKGSGAESSSDIEKCNDCHGSGMVTRSQRTPFGIFQTTTTCSTCGGQGTIIKELCPMCDGEGRIRKERKIKASIPAGVDNGTMLRIGEEGEAGEKGARPGDLYVVISVASHKIFERQENDLYVEVPISFVGAALGDDIEVPTIDGKAKLKVPAGTQSNTLFRMKGHGVPYINSSEKGDEFVKVVVYTPKNLNKKQKEMLKKLAKELGDQIKPQKGFLERLKDQFT